MADERKRVFSGIQPSGNLHLGNYLGALKNWVAIQEDYENYFCIVDLHALTVPQDPKVLREKIREVAAIYLAVGLDPEHCTIFRQSRVSEHTELAWLLNCIARFGELSRMTQFKDKSRKEGAESASVGLFDYPVLQAADILLYNAHLVPVGEDQRQHLELTRTLARRFNHLYGETFVVPEIMILETGARVMALDEPEEKMSKSSPRPASYVAILDEPDVIRRKIRRAVTDSGTEIVAAPEKPAITNLLQIYAAMTERKIPDIEAEYAGRGYGDFKKDLAEIVVEGLAPVRERALELLENPAELDELLESGAGRAREAARPNLHTAWARMGLD
ncbi:tryptophan--tRNA ligase [Rubrobacter taiwanensis]|jgi:tryptophanyl-tRNA synthetase|uniref:Tryptophan--tRNA ligase n=1 Tax=Rubrobacter taiwanensis TaxID=185139 RepID=A0A4R1BSB5_9ACTN|nr:tryptophan--tRNA ligase [Rubrobacter taiwanensis]TCJ20518.1 tryptophan--tRNA ligase [Rubrobacter taiwanensis]